jgi:cysteine desulfurase/selenocysteine lyase
MDQIQAYKEAFRRENNLIHLNNAGVSPWPISTERAFRDWSAKLATEGTHVISEVFAKSEETRAQLGSIIGAEATQIAFFQTCASAISQVAFGLSLKLGDEIIVWDQEYPSNFYPWKLAADRAGAKLVIASSTDRLATPFENLEKVVTPRTRVIATSWVQYRTGAILDLEAVAKFANARGIFTCVDIIQGAGLLPLDFNSLGIDAACGGSHKWFTSPAALGFLILKPEHIETLAPLSVGAMSYGGFDLLSNVTTPMSKGVQRFEPGGRSLLEMIGFGETLKLIAATGVDRIAQETEWLSRKLMHGLRELGYTIHSPHGSHHRGSIVNFSPTAQAALKTIEDIEQRLIGAKVSFSKRQPGMRLSPHAFVTSDQIDHVLRVLS